MNDREIVEALDRMVRRDTSTFCACGAPRSVAPAFHRRSTNHDCVHHQRRSCGCCRAADRLIAGVEARLFVEAQHGPFIVTRWEWATQR